MLAGIFIQQKQQQLVASILQKYLVKAKAKVQQLLINPLLHSLHQAEHARTLTHARSSSLLLALGLNCSSFQKGDDFHTPPSPFLALIPNHYLLPLNSPTDAIFALPPGPSMIGPGSTQQQERQ